MNENRPRTTGPRRAGRPVTPLLNRPLIAGAALEIVTSSGVDGLTMKSLAGHLGVSVSSLYNHIAGKSELLASVQDAVMSRVDTAAFAPLVQGASSEVDRAELLDTALHSWARSYRRAFADYPSLVPLIATMPVAGAPRTRRMYDTVAAGLLAAGLPTAQVMPVIVAFESFLFGSAMDVHAPASIFSSRPGESDAPAFRRAVDAFTGSVDEDPEAPSDDPSLPGHNPYADRPFEWGLDTLVAGTLALLAD